VPTVVEELVSARTQEREDVLEVRGRAGRGAERRRIERSTPHGEEGKTRQAAKMEDRPREDCREP
jgi:hypothetical protein